MHPDLSLSLAGLIVGFVVGLTGMGGGALMTPILVLIFGVQPLAAVSSDLMASLIMKPVGAGVHAKHGTVNLNLVKWLCIGSVPSAFCGVLLLRAMGDGEDMQNRIKYFLGAALLLAAFTMVAKGVIDTKRKVRKTATTDITVKPIPTLLIGVLGGLIVGMTSVGSGSLIIVLLLVLYPTLSASSLVGTDLVQAIPLVGAAALGHLLFGDFQLSLTTWLLVGALPGVYFGARISAKAPDHVIRPALVFVLLISSLKLLGMGTTQLGEVIGVACVLGMAYIGYAKFIRKPAPAAGQVSPATVAD